MSLLDLGPSGGKAWLDAGCGTGVLARALSSRGCRVTGVDGSRQMIDAARNSTPHRGGPVENEPVFELVDTVERLHFPRSSFDGIVCSSVLEYLEDPVRTIGEFHRVLKPGGLLLASVPGRASPLRNFQKILYVISRSFLGFPWPQYLTFSNHSYTCRGFNCLLRDSGFQVISRKDYDPYMPKFMLKIGFNPSMMIFLGRKEGL